MLYALLIYAIFIFILLFGIKFRPLTKEADFFFLLTGYAAFSLWKSWSDMLSGMNLLFYIRSENS